MTMYTPDDDKAIVKLLAKYRNAQQTKRDVVDVLNKYRLNYKLESFVFNDGATKELFNLHGTIPVNYKNNTYYIPICIWLMDTHPQNAPLCYVKPTADMSINVSMFVDHNGKIYLPYLHDWQPNVSDVLGLIQVMIITFGDSPPVFAKPKQPSPYPNPYSSPPSGGGSNSGYGLPYPSAGGASGPTGGAGGYPPYPLQIFNNMPPYPLMGSNSPAGTGTNGAGIGMPYPMSSGGGSAGGGPPYPSPYPPASGYGGGATGGMSGYGDTSSSSGSVGPGMAQQGTISEEHIKASLISAIDDKIRRQVNERKNQYEAEINTLRRTKDELLEGRSKIYEIMQRLDNEERDLKSHLGMLRSKDQELEKQVDALSKIDKIDVDEAVTTTAPLYKQLLNAYAEEAAIEDVIYYLGEALRTNVIDLELFLKHVRQLSRKQFMLRAIMQKCRQRAGLMG